MESHVECVQVILDERDKPKTKLQEGGAMDLAQQIEVQSGFTVWVYSVFRNEGLVAGFISRQGVSTGSAIR
jgi:hypothetical protein